MSKIIPPVLDIDLFRDLLEQIKQDDTIYQRVAEAVQKNSGKFSEFADLMWNDIAADNRKAEEMEREASKLYATARILRARAKSARLSIRFNRDNARVERLRNALNYRSACLKSALIEELLAISKLKDMNPGNKMVYIEAIENVIRNPPKCKHVRWELCPDDRSKVRCTRCLEIRDYEPKSDGVDLQTDGPVGSSPRTEAERDDGGGGEEADRELHQTGSDDDSGIAGEDNC